ncbi:MAG: O-antigen/teichoic acid export membrane protein [Cyclobacteriaceae bacterium]|jgi:O-antigen/teichoic acid export membrane protein
MKASTKVVLNTVISYVKIGMTMLITLFTTRYALDALGVTDYGLYNLIAGIVALLAFFNSALTVSTQRYLSFNQGMSGISLQKEVFQSSLILHVIIGLVIVGIMELAGLVIFDGFLNIPTDKIDTAIYIYHFLAVSILFTVLATPFTASINAHEELHWIALVNIGEVLIKLGIALTLYYVEEDRLLVYGILIPSISILIFFIYALIGFKRYQECSLTEFRHINFSKMKEMSAYAGWNLFGSMAGLARSQGIAVMFNLFYGIGINAAYAICIQVELKVRFLSASLMQVLNPQIMKSEGAGDRERMLQLSMMASKFGFFLVAIVSIPMIFEMEEVLGVWLKEIPDFTVVFCQLTLLATLFNQLTVGLQSALQATGRIRKYLSVVGSLILLNLPIAYGLLAYGSAPQTVLVSFVLIELAASLLRIYFINSVANLSYMTFYKRVIRREILPTLASIGVCWGIIINIDLEYRFLLTGFMSTVTFVFFAYFFGLENKEKTVINKLILSFKEYYRIRIN